MTDRDDLKEKVEKIAQHLLSQEEAIRGAMYATLIIAHDLYERLSATDAATKPAAIARLSGHLSELKNAGALQSTTEQMIEGLIILLKSPVASASALAAAQPQGSA